MGLKKLRKLGQKKYRQETGLYLLEGTVSVTDALEAGAEIVAVVHDSRVAKRKAEREILGRLRSGKVEVREASESDLKAMSGLSTPPPLIAAVRKPPRSVPSIPAKPGLTICLDRIGDPGNVGTLLRTAAFYGVAEVWLGAGTAELYNPKTLRAAMSAHLHLAICSGVDLEETINESKGHGATVIASVVEEGEPPVYIQSTGESVVLLLGSEAHGLDPRLLRLADRRVAIPGTGQVDSLNVAMAGTILIDRLLRP